MRRPSGPLAPWPFVGVTVLLVVLIFLTPVLISNGQPAPGVLTQADLIVDRVAGSGATHFYVVGYDSTTRYSGIWVDADENFSWQGAGSVNWTGIRWTDYQNASDVVVLAFNSTGSSVALNVSAYYVSPGGNALYVGELAFYVGTDSSSPSGLALYAQSSSAAVYVPSLTPVDNNSLPLRIALAVGSTASVP